ncbi:MAG TPA: hypothetical protein VGR84_05920 [Candidatus Acidoferrales bacterium]|nr:hypothetical protein [Candidatus Acidoferrales bacterium]
MKLRDRVHNARKVLLVVAAVLLMRGSTLAQVSPTEVLNPRLKAAAAKYLPQLESLHQSIAATKFPFPFALARYLQSEPSKQASFDSRGIEFVYFQNRVILKVSGIYSAAYNADQLTQNERASKTFRDVIIPILHLVAEQIPRDVDCDDIGFEIVYHAHTSSKNYDYEGKEVLAAVLDRADAFALVSAPEREQQDILNRSRIYVNGKDFGLALDQLDPFDVQALARSVPGRTAASAPPGAGATTSTSSVTNPPAASAVPAGVEADKIHRATPAPVPVFPEAARPLAAPPSVTASQAAPTQADAERLQSQFQSQLDALVKSHGTDFHFVDYAPPSFAVYHNQIVLQFTLRDPAQFQTSSSSIYKRAAQSFDLFLAPRLKALMQKLPSSDEIEAVDFSVLHHLGGDKESSEAAEFICPVKALRSFTGDEITSQDLINQSIVLVNGIRITLNLQAVE